MKRSLKMLAASVLACSAPGVFAAIATDGAQNLGGGNNSGELFVSVFRDVVGQEMSDLFDTGITTQQLLGGTVANGTLLGNVGSFFTTAPTGSFVLNAGAIANGGATGLFGNIFTSSNASGVAAQAGAIDVSGVFSINNQMFQFVNQTAPSGESTALNNSYLGLLSGSQGFHNSVYWGDNLGGSSSLNTEGGLNVPLALWAVTVNADFETFSSRLLGYVVADSASGDITFSTGGTPEVPLPAAVWLLGSGLAGLLGVSRRRRQALA